jgi:hypothetical protein
MGRTVLVDTVMDSQLVHGITVSCGLARRTMERSVSLLGRMLVSQKNKAASVSKNLAVKNECLLGAEAPAQISGVHVQSRVTTWPSRVIMSTLARTHTVLKQSQPLHT